MTGSDRRAVALHAGLVLVLLVAETVAPDYVRLQLTRVMVLAVYAILMTMSVQRAKKMALQEEIA